MGRSFEMISRLPLGRRKSNSECISLNFSRLETCLCACLIRQSQSMTLLGGCGNTLLFCHCHHYSDRTRLFKLELESKSEPESVVGNDGFLWQTKGKRGDRYRSGG